MTSSQELSRHVFVQFWLRVMSYPINYPQNLEQNKDYENYTKLSQNQK